MKPRLSILAILGVTAYVAVNLAALVAPLSIWNVIGCSLWLLGVFVLAVECVVARPPRSVFYKGMHIFFVTYCAISLMLSRVTVFDSVMPRMSPPHDLIMTAIDVYTPMLPYTEHVADVSAELGELRAKGELSINQSGRERAVRQRLVSDRRDRLPGELRLLLFTQCSFVFAILGGLLALWRHRVLERREQREKSST